MSPPQKVSVVVRSALKEATDTLASRRIEPARLEAELLLANVVNERREYFLTHPDQPLTDPQEEQFQNLVERRCGREPLAYLVGQREFWSLEFKVNAEVLIPRPETEGIIERLLYLAGKAAQDTPLRILDVGTGSGILAIVAALEFPQARITAVDYSSEALEVARENAVRHRVVDRIEWIPMDCRADWNLPASNRYDFILSNPPYISTQDWHHLMSDVRDYEPRLALDGGPDGLEYYRCIVANALSHLKPGGHLIFETGADQAASLQQILHTQGGWDHIEVMQDLSGRDRVVSTRRVLG